MIHTCFALLGTFTSTPNLTHSPIRQPNPTQDQVPEVKLQDAKHSVVFGYAPYGTGAGESRAAKVGENESSKIKDERILGINTLKSQEIAENLKGVL
jgi:hypothetical protein